MLDIHQLDTRRLRDSNRFINLPFKLYADCPQWVPPLLPDARLQLNRDKNPYYRRNDAAFFMASRDGRDVGRICVMHPKYLNDFKGTHFAFFYLFDCADDQEAANSLFDAAAQWARERNLAILKGPHGFMAADGFGMLARGFEHRPAIGIPYNYDYYLRLAETWGFQLEERVYSGYVNLDEIRANFPQRIVDIAEKVKQRYGFETRTYRTKQQLRKEVAPQLHELYNRTLTHITGDPPLSPEEVAVVTENLLLISDPQMIKFIAKGDEIIGFLFCFLDISEGLQKARGRLFPFGLLHILADLRRTIWLNFNGMGILPEYQGRGGTALLYAELFKVVQEQTHFKHGDVVQISEFNAQSLNEMKKFGIDFHKTHHIYRRELNEEGTRS